MSAMLLVAGCADSPQADSSWCVQDYVALTGRVVDQASIIPAELEARLSQGLERFEQKTRHQFVVATVDSLQGKAITDYSLCLARHWGIGRAGIDDGVVLLVAPNEKKMRIEVGYGLEAKLADDEAASIMRDVILPEVQAGNMPRAIDLGAAAIIAQAS